MECMPSITRGSASTHPICKGLGSCLLVLNEGETGATKVEAGHANPVHPGITCLVERLALKIILPKVRADLLQEWDCGACLGRRMRTGRLHP